MSTTDAMIAAPECVNLEPATDAELGRGHLSTTQIGTLLACEQRWYWDQERRLRPAVRPVALSLGAAFATAVEHGDPDRGALALMDEWLRGSEEHGSNPWVVVPSREEAMEQAAIVRGASRAYIGRYGSRELREQRMRVRIRNPLTGRPSVTFDLVCRVDGLSDDASTLIEDKLVGQIPRKAGEMDRRLRLDRQLTIAAYCTWRTTGVLPSEIRYRMTLKPSIRQRQNESIEGYLKRVEADYAERPDHYLAEFTATRTLEDFARLERELWRWAEQLRSARADGVWPRNTAACADFGGCRFLPLCSGEPGAAHQFVEREVKTQEVVAA